MRRGGYQLLGFTVWRGAGWYLRRRYGDISRKLAIAALLGVAVAALGFAQRHSSSQA